MQKIIVADSSCLILFFKIKEFELLKDLFGEIIITEIVSREFKHEIPDWIKIINPQTNIQHALIGFLDAGEASSIALASEYKDSLLIIDELKGRRIAKELGIEVSGSLGILITAKNKRIIPAVKPVLDKIKQTNFRLSDALIQNILALAGEQD